MARVLVEAGEESAFEIDQLLALLFRTMALPVMVPHRLSMCLFDYLCDA